MMLCPAMWLWAAVLLLLLCPSTITGQYGALPYGYGGGGQQRQESFSYEQYGPADDPCADIKDTVTELQSSVSSLSTTITSQFTQVNDAVQKRCDTKTVIKTIMSGMQSSKKAYTDEIKALLAEVATKTDLQTLHSKQIEMALAQVATDDQLANSTMMLQMELQMMKDQMANKEDFRLVMEAVKSSSSILKQELDLVKTELAELKKTCQGGCHTANQKVCVYKNESYYVGSFDIGCDERCQCFANSTMICQDRCSPPYFSVGSLSHDPLCTEIPSGTDKCCVNVSCNTTIITDSSSRISLNESNIVDHGGFRPGGTGPENLLHDNGFWNPNPQPWYVIFDFHRRFTVDGVELSNFGDVTHDVAHFTLETADNITSTDNFKLVTRVTNVEKGINDPQLFTFSPATGRYWRFKIIKTYSEFQPWIEELILHGHPTKELSCPPQFGQVGSQCLLVVIKGLLTTSTWGQARYECQNLGGRLAQLKDTTHIVQHITTDLGKENWKFWVGAEWKNKEDGFQWITSGDKVSNWEDDQPDNGGFKLFDHSDEHCVELQAWNGKYNDQDCDEGRSFVCEADPLETTLSEKPATVTSTGSESNNTHGDEHQVQQQHQLEQSGQEEHDTGEQQEPSNSMSSPWRNCDDVHEYMLLQVRDPPSSIRRISPFKYDVNKKVMAYCDHETDGGGWTVFQHRGDYNHYPSGPLDFNKLWDDYKEGFGDPEEDHWLGLDAISALSNQGPTELYILLGDFNGEQRWAHYDHFVVHNETTGYTLQVSGYSGDAGDSFTHHSGQKFTTIDVDNDNAKSSNCAYEFGGAWWHNKCHESNLNGRYLRGAHLSYADGIEWKAWHGYYYSLNTTTMMLRPRRDIQDDMQQGVIQDDMQQQQGVIKFPGPAI